MIYRLVVVEGVIRIQPNTTPAEPSLLQVNKQIRKEAIQLYYKENVFCWRIRAFDARHYIAWCQSSQLRHSAQCRYTLTGPRNWNNVLHWLEALFKNECNAPRMLASGAVAPSIAPGATMAKLARLVMKMKLKQQLKWEAIKANLELVHKVICELDQRWALEKDAF